MTSKNSYFDLVLIGDRLRKNAWIITLYSVVLFFAMPVFMAIRLQGYQDRVMENKKQFMTELITGFFSIDNKFILLLAIAAAIIAAATVFYYINSKKQMDFYHSLPIKRQKLFTTNFSVGVLFFVIPYIVSVILSVIVIMSTGNITYLTPEAVITGFLLNLLLYIVVYSITVFAMILCGNLIVGLMGTAVFLAYGPLLCVTYIETMRYFYKNYYTELYRVENIARNSSPMFDFMVTNRQYVFSATRVVAYILLALALIGLSLYLYTKRPSEGAGHAIAFKNSRPVIKYPIVFLCTLTSGLFFMSAGSRSIGWMVFGLVCGGVLSHFIIEIIYHFDFKAIFKNIKGLALFAVLFAVFISIPVFDLTGYDSRLPKSTDIKNASLRIMNFNENSYFTSSMDRMGSSYYTNGRFYPINREREMLDKLKLSQKENIDVVYKLAQMGIANTGDKGSGYNACIGVEFELNNGTKVTRKYLYLKSSEIEPYIVSIFDTKEFKQKFYNLYSIDRNEVSKISILDLYSRSGMNESAQISENNKIVTIIDALRVDMLKQRGNDMKNETPVMLISIIKGEPKVRVDFEIQVPVYESFTQTMNIINSMGIDKPKMIDEAMVDYIQINNYEYEKYMARSYAEARSTEYKEMAKNSYIRITNKAEIYEILKQIVPDSTMNYNPFFESERGYRANVVSSKYMNGYSESFIFRKDRVPEFVKAKFPIPKEK